MADLMKCNCKHEFQDATYGKNMRVVTRDKNKNPHCTVCGGFPAWITRLASHAKAWLPIHGK